MMKPTIILYVSFAKTMTFDSYKGPDVNKKCNFRGLVTVVRCVNVVAKMESQSSMASPAHRVNVSLNFLSSVFLPLRL